MIGIRTRLVSRGELYDAVWSEDTKAAAARFGLTRNSLRKSASGMPFRCPAGTKCVGGKAALTSCRTALPTLETGQQITLRIAPKPGNKGAGSALFQPADDAEKAFPSIIVSSDLALLHHVTIALEQALERPADENGMVDSAGAAAFFARVHPSSVDRVLRIADALARACDTRGFGLRQGNQGAQPDGGMQVMVDGTGIDIGLTERVRVRSYRLNAAEIEQQKNGFFAVTRPAELTPIG